MLDGHGRSRVLRSAAPARDVRSARDLGDHPLPERGGGGRQGRRPGLRGHSPLGSPGRGNRRRQRLDRPLRRGRDRARRERRLRAASRLRERLPRRPRRGAAATSSSWATRTTRTRSSELGAFVDRLEQGDDLVIGSRFNGTIHGDAMPFLNRFVGNPILTGMLNVLFGVKVSDAHCGMRAVRREALPRARPPLDRDGVRVGDGLQGLSARAQGQRGPDRLLPARRASRSSTASATRGVTCASCSSTARAGSTSCREVFLLLLGIVGMLVLAAGPDRHLRPHVADPHDARLRRADAHRRAGHPARRLRTNVRARPHRRARPRCSSGSVAHLTLEHGLIIGVRSSLAALAGLVAVGARVGVERLRDLGRAYETALLVTALGLGIQIVFGAFFLALLNMPLRRETTSGDTARPATCRSTSGR